MKIAAKTEISPHEEALIQDFIKQMRQEHPNLELSMNDIYDSALRTGCLRFVLLGRFLT